MSSSGRINSIQTTKYRWMHRVLNLLVIILLVFVLAIPGMLRLIYRADSQVALGNAKSVRMAFQVTGTEAYGRNEAFCDASKEGGIREGLYEEILSLSKVPGDFWVLQTDETGYQIRKFVYIEGEYTVWYDADASSVYTVYHEDTMIDTGE